MSKVIYSAVESNFQPRSTVLLTVSRTETCLLWLRPSGTAGVLLRVLGP